MNANHLLGGPVELNLVVECENRLQALRLSAEHLSALAQQGFVTAEHRGQHGPFFKLRFRWQGRQVVRYLGKDAEVADQVQREVLKLQAERHLTKELHRLTVEARKVLRQTKHELQPGVEAAGLKFHGFALRRTLGPKS